MRKKKEGSGANPRGHRFHSGADVHGRRTKGLWGSETYGERRARGTTKYALGRKGNRRRAPRFGVFFLASLRELLKSIYWSICLLSQERKRNFDLFGGLQNGHHFEVRIRKEIQADPACVDLRSRCPYFYELGCKIVPLVSDTTLGSFILYTLRGRYKDILCKAHSVAFSVTSKFLQLLTREESQLFEAARESIKAFKKWRLQGSRMEKACVLGRKRRQMDPLIASDIP